MTNINNYKYLIQNELQKRMPNCTGWISSLGLDYNEKKLELRLNFPHKFFNEWFFAQYKDIFEHTIQDIFLQNYNETPRIIYNNSQKINKENFFQLKNKKRQKQDFFKDFIYNAKNEFPVRIAREVSENPLNSAYNPLIFHGKSCTGKTALLHCIKQNIIQNHMAEQYIFEADGDEFCDRLINNGVLQFVESYKIFLIDNTHDDLIIPIEKEFFNFIRICIQQKKQVIFLSTQNTQNQMQWIERLRLQIYSALLLELKNPDIDVRMRYGIMECHNLQLKISKENILLLAQRCISICILKNILSKINAYAKLYDKEIQRKDIENILMAEDEEIRNLTPSAIISFVANYFAMSEENILSNRKNPDIVHARYVTMYLCRDLLGLSYPSIGKIFGGKDHTTVIYAIKKIKKMTDTNKNMQIMVSDLRIKCLAM